MPQSAGKLLDLLAVAAGERQFAALGPTGRLQPGRALPPAAPIFPRFVEPEAAGTAS